VRNKVPDHGISFSPSHINNIYIYINKLQQMTKGTSLNFPLLALLLLGVILPLGGIEATPVCGPNDHAYEYFSGTNSKMPRSNLV